MNRPRISSLAITLFLVGLVALPPVNFASDRRALTVDDVLDLVKIDDVVMTPDGSRVFYSERRVNWETNKYEKTFFMVASTGGEPVPFVRKDGAKSFRISPAGRYLSMLREVDERPQVFLMDLDGGEPRQLTAHRGKITDYDWAGDSQSIVFLAEEARTEAEQKEFDLGEDPVFVNEGPHGKNHGRWTHLWRVALETREETRVTAADMLIDGFDVSPDGTRVVFSARPDNRGNFPFLSELYVAGTDGSAPRRLTRNRALERDPLWAPDGRTFVFHASDDESFELRNGFLRIMNPDTGQVRRLDGQQTGDIDHLVWTPDGRSLLFNEVHGTSTNVYRLDVSSGQLEALTRREGTLRALAFSRDRRRIAWTFDDFDTPADLFVSGPDGEDPVRLTNANPWVESDILLPRSEVVRWKSTDGTPIEGILMLPGDHRPGNRLPLVLQIHGGPPGYWGNTFEPDLAVYAGLGYAVLGPNVRGSSALRGRAPSRADGRGGRRRVPRLDDRGRPRDRSGPRRPRAAGGRGLELGRRLCGLGDHENEPLQGGLGGRWSEQLDRGERPRLQLGRLHLVHRRQALDEPGGVEESLRHQLRREGGDPHPLPPRRGGPDEQHQPEHGLLRRPPGTGRPHPLRQVPPGEARDTGAPPPAHPDGGGDPLDGEARPGSGLESTDPAGPVCLRLGPERARAPKPQEPESRDREESQAGCRQRSRKEEKRQGQ